MEIKYKKNKLEKQLTDASEMKKAFGVNAKRVAIRMADMQDSPNLAVLMQIPSANCHPLTGNRKGEWAVDISGNYRIIFEIDQNPIPENDDGSICIILITDIRILEITDYH